MAHIAFSRKLLTDVPFLLTWIVAMGLGGRFLERPSLRRAVLFGLAVGVAQNFKYNGWIAGVVVILAAVLGLLADREARQRARLVSTFGWGALAALVAIVTYLPWFRFVEQNGGYLALLRHHRNYMGDASTWVLYWRQQLAQVVALSGGFAIALSVWCAAWLGAGIATGGMAWFRPESDWDASRLRVGLLIGVAALATLPEISWWIGLAWSAWLVADSRPALRVLGASWLILSLMTPFYHPYARLWLPLHAVGWLMLAGVAVSLGPFSGTLSEVPRPALLRDRRLIIQAAVTAYCLLLAWFHWGGVRPRAIPLAEFFQRTDGFRIAAAELRKVTPLAGDTDPHLRVLARRPLVFYFMTGNLRHFVLLPDESTLTKGKLDGHDWALVDGVQIGEAIDDGPSWREIDRRWSRVAVWRLPLDPVTRLDVNAEAPYELYPPDPTSLALLYPRAIRHPMIPRSYLFLDSDR
jgi:hypothetical protein